MTIYYEFKPSEGLSKSTLDTLPANIGLLDATGIILFVNKSWRDFAEQNGLSANECSEGTNYLQVYDAATGEWSKEAAKLCCWDKEIPI